MKRLFPCWFTRPRDKIPQYFQRRIGYRHVYAIPEGCLRAPLQRHEDRLCAARLQNWTGTVFGNFCAELFRRKTKFRRVLPSLCINNF